MRIRLGILGIVGVSAIASVSSAYPAHRFWHIPAAGDPGAGQTTGRAGAGGIYYTGGKTDYGFKCSQCHINNAGQQNNSPLGYTVTPSPAWGSSGGADGYTPGTTYTITVQLTGEHLHLLNGATPVDQNGMALTIEDSTGAVAGVFEANVGGKSDSANCQAGTAGDPLTVEPTSGQTTVLYGDCHGVLSAASPGTGPTRTSWNFKWTAPAAGKGELTIHLGLVDGDNADKSSLDDDVKEASIPLVEL